MPTPKKPTPKPAAKKPSAPAAKKTAPVAKPATGKRNYKRIAKTETPEEAAYNRMWKSDPFKIKGFAGGKKTI